MTKPLVLEKMLQIVPFEGWTDSSYREAVAKAGLTEIQAQLLFPHSLRDALDFFAFDADQRMSGEYLSWSEKPQKIHHRIIALVKLRLNQNRVNRESIRRAQAYYLIHPLDGFKVVARTVDEIWHLAGDNATDFNWYSKRFLLANVYVTTVNFWLNDESEEQTETWEFLERRITDVLKIGKFRRTVEEKIKSWLPQAS